MKIQNDTGESVYIKIKRQARQTMRQGLSFPTHTLRKSPDITIRFFLSFVSIWPIFGLFSKFYCQNEVKRPPQISFDLTFKMAPTSQFLSKTHAKHVKRCAKVSAFEHTLLESLTISQSVFFTFL